MKASDKKLKNDNWKVKIIKANETSDAISQNIHLTIQRINEISHL